MLERGLEGALGRGQQSDLEEREVWAASKCAGLEDACQILEDLMGQCEPLFGLVQEPTAWGARARGSWFLGRGPKDLVVGQGRGWGVEVGMCRGEGVALAECMGSGGAGVFCTLTCPGCRWGKRGQRGQSNAGSRCISTLGGDDGGWEANHWGQARDWLHRYLTT